MRAISSRDIKFFELAMLVARNSECNYRHGAVITRGGNIISLAANRLGSHRKQSKHGEYVITIHAETRAIIKSCSPTEGCTLYSARYCKKSGGMAISRPCAICTEIMLEAGIHTVVYFDGYLRKERL